MGAGWETEERGEHGRWSGGGGGGTMSKLIRSQAGRAATGRQAKLASLVARGARGRLAGLPLTGRKSFAGKIASANPVQSLILNALREGKSVDVTQDPKVQRDLAIAVAYWHPSDPKPITVVVGPMAPAEGPSSTFPGAEVYAETAAGASVIAISPAMYEDLERSAGSKGGLEGIESAARAMVHEYGHVEGLPDVEGSTDVEGVNWVWGGSKLEATEPWNVGGVSPGTSAGGSVRVGKGVRGFGTPDRPWGPSK